MSRINAKDEFLRYTENLKIIGGVVIFKNGYENDDEEFTLPLLHTEEQYENLLKFLDRLYDNGFGGQELYGTILCEDGVWLDRGEYDGSEWWQINAYPDLHRFFDDKLILKYQRSKKLEKLNGEI